MGSHSWAGVLAKTFPNLAREGFEIVDEPSTRYNCIAYAAGDTTKWWEHTGRRYWPPHATRSDRTESLREVFSGLGFEPCADSNPESGYEKVALYEQGGAWKHAAVQLPNGRWRSKMGQGPVIEHRNPESLSGGVYGNATATMRRLVSASS